MNVKLFIRTIWGQLVRNYTACYDWHTFLVGHPEKMVVFRASTVSSSGEGNGSSSSSVRPRDTFNIFLNQSQIQPLGRPWLDWGEVSFRTRQRYVQRTSEIVAAVLNVISPKNAPDLWKALQSSSALNLQLGLHHASPPSEAAYLEALAEAYSDAGILGGRCYP